MNKHALAVAALCMAPMFAHASSTFTMTGTTATSSVIDNGDGTESLYNVSTGIYSLVTSLTQLFTFTLVDTITDGYNVTYSISGTGGDHYSFNMTDTNNGISPSYSLVLNSGETYTVTITSAARAVFTDVSAVPLPGAALLFGSAALGAAALRRRKNKAANSIMAMC